jgi:hypothetical protein
VLGYRLYRDLKRGWRVTMPNLEQCGLLAISYESLDELVEAEDVWQGTHPVLASASPQVRAEVCQALLDDLRRNLAISVRWLDPDEIEVLREQSYQRLNARWGIERDEKAEQAAVAYPRTRGRHDRRTDHFLSGYGGFGRWLRKPTTFTGWRRPRLTRDETTRVIGDLLRALREAQLVKPVQCEGGEGYQVLAAAMVWRAGDGTKPFHDRSRTPDRSVYGGRVNPYFVEFYRRVAPSCAASTRASTRRKCSPNCAVSARRTSAKGRCQCCTAHRRWSWAWTSTSCTRSTCATSRPPPPTTRSGPGARAGRGSLRS